MFPNPGVDMTLLRTSLAACLVAVALVPAAAHAQQSTPPPVEQPPGEPAQEQDSRPFRGIFGVPDANPRHSLVFSGSVFGAYDDNVIAALTTGGGNNTNRRLQQGGGYGAAFGGLNYGLAMGGPRFSLGVHAGAQLRYYYYDGDSDVAPYYHDAATAAMRLALTRRTRFTATQTFAYSSNYRFHVFPIEGVDDTIEPIVDADSDLDLFQMTVLRHITTVSLSHNFGRNTTGSIGYGLRYVDFRQSAEADTEPGPVRRFRDYSNQSIFGRLEHHRQISANTSAHIGYGFRWSDAVAGTGEPRSMHHINAGVSYDRALSFSRRTRLRFSTGSAITGSERLTDEDFDPRSRFRILGNVSLIHQMGRTWTASATYRRGVVFREGFADPWFTDGASARVEGLITRRWAFSATGAWALSNLQRTGQTGHRAFVANAQSTYALNQYLALFARYIYYDYAFEEDVPLDPEIPRAMSRQGVRAGISTSIRIF